MGMLWSSSRMAGLWHVYLRDEPPRESIGWPLGPIVAEVIGYNVGIEDWPRWIDVWAAEVVREARSLGVDGRFDPVGLS
jgi:hypothetical protein